MAPALVVVDLLYLAGLAGLGAAAVTAGLEAHGALAPHLPAPLSAGVGALAGVLAWILAAALASALVPRPRPGKYPVAGHPVFWVWTAAFLLRRFLQVQPFHAVLFHCNVLRYVVMRLLGARVRYTTMMSSDVLLLDPALFEAGPGCVLGAQSIYAGHLILEKRLLLAPIRLGSRVEIGGRSMLAPGVEVGDDARVGVAVSLGPRVVIGAGASIGAHALVDAGARVGKGARVLGNTYVPPGTEIADGGVWTGE
jgi:acetyltransferase-like isoleucine patch superfamily enzyme